MAEVIDKPSRGCACGMTYADGDDSSSRMLSDHAHARARGRKILRRLPPTQRKFALALKHVLEVVPGPQDLHREKIMKRLKIGRRMYFYLLAGLHKNLV